jgi:hypothetical protein
MKSTAMTLIGAGIALMLLGSIWPHLWGVQTMWSDRQAAEYADSAASLHHLAHEASHAPSDARVAEALEAARRRFDASTAALASAKAGRATIVGFLRWTGAILLLAGGVVHFRTIRRIGAGR